jgi:hypothetical protein
MKDLGENSSNLNNYKCKNGLFILKDELDKKYKKF